MGFYIYTDPLNYLILYISVNCFGLTSLTTEFGSLLVYLTRTVETMLVAYGICKFFERHHIKYLY